MNTGRAKSPFKSWLQQSLSELLANRPYKFDCADNRFGFQCIRILDLSPIPFEETSGCLMKIVYLLPRRTNKTNHKQPSKGQVTNSVREQKRKPKSGQSRDLKPAKDPKGGGMPQVLLKTLSRF